MRWSVEQYLTASHRSFKHRKTHARTQRGRETRARDGAPKGGKGICRYAPYEDRPPYYGRIRTRKKTTTPIPAPPLCATMSPTGQLFTPTRSRVPAPKSVRCVCAVESKRLRQRGEIFSYFLGLLRNVRASSFGFFVDSTFVREGTKSAE